MIKTSIITGVIFGLIVVSIWVLWAMLLYRYSNERKADLILKKYSVLNPVDDDKFYKVSNIETTDNLIAVVIEIRFKKTQKVFERKYLTYRTSECDMYESNCIIL